jgi:hypothetical protein
MDSNQTQAEPLTETGVYRFQRQLDAACIARVTERFNRPLTPEAVELLLGDAS